MSKLSFFTAVFFSLLGGIYLGQTGLIGTFGESFFSFASDSGEIVSEQGDKDGGQETLKSTKKKPVGIFVGKNIFDKKCNPVLCTYRCLKAGGEKNECVRSCEPERLICTTAKEEMISEYLEKTEIEQLSEYHSSAQLADAELQSDGETDPSLIESDESIPKTSSSNADMQGIRVQNTKPKQKQRVNKPTGESNKLSERFSKPDGFAVEKNTPVGNSLPEVSSHKKNGDYSFVHEFKSLRVNSYCSEEKCNVLCNAKGYSDPEGCKEICISQECVDSAKKALKNGGLYKEKYRWFQKSPAEIKRVLDK